jgi:hypothetical protein
MYMRRFSLLLTVVFAAACGNSTEPKIISGSFTLTAVNGVPAEAPFDTSHCANVYEPVSFLQLNSGSANIHIRAHPNCRSGDNVYDDVGSYTVSGQTITMRLNRQSMPFTGTVSANGDTLSVDFRDVWNPDTPATARITFARF